jgi:hypothetical protein
MRCGFWILITSPIVPPLRLALKWYCILYVIFDTLLKQNDVFIFDVNGISSPYVIFFLSQARSGDIFVASEEAQTSRHARTKAALFDEISFKVRMND